jgi:class 3 adenylate cyclase
VGTDVRGIAVHEAARILNEAKENEILVSATTRALAASSGFAFQNRGSRPLKGLQGEWELFAYLEQEEPAGTDPVGASLETPRTSPGHGLRAEHRWRA